MRHVKGRISKGMWPKTDLLTPHVQKALKYYQYATGVLEGRKGACGVGIELNNIPRASLAVYGGNGLRHS
jgi:hypothetical protein